MEQLTLGAIIKLIQKQDEKTHFAVPDDIFCHGSKFVDGHNARKQLAFIQITWKLKGHDTKFSVWGEETLDIWDKDELRFIERKVIKITAHNERIQEFAASISSLGD